MDKLLHDRFVANFKINKSNNCWEWQKPLSEGYGTFYLRSVKGKSITMRAHRFSYEWHVGIIESGLFVLHKCDNRRCVNPDHLFLGTAKDNYDDMVRKGRKPDTRCSKYKHTWKPYAL